MTTEQKMALVRLMLIVTAALGCSAATLSGTFAAMAAGVPSAELSLERF
jgi:hypothetical protein